MDQRADYLFQILEKIGGPLVAAIAHRQKSDILADSAPEASAREEAQTIAQLLARSVQMSIEIGQVMELDMTNPETADRLRLALMVLAGPLIAGQYRHDGRVPGDSEQKKMMTGLEAVLAFSQNFAATADNASELAGTEGSSGENNSGAEMVKAMRHFTPVINAIGAFPFGQPEKKLIQDVSLRIIAKVDDMAGKLFPDLGNAGKLLLIKTLAEIYSECHTEEMRAMLSKNQEEPDVQQGLNSIWARFDVRAAMLEALAVNLLPEGTAPAYQAPPAQQPEADPVFTPAQAPTIFKAPAATTESAPPAASNISQAPQESLPPAGFNPMAMFGKKQDDAIDEPPAPPPSAAEPPPPLTPPLPPITAAQESDDGAPDDTSESGTSDAGSSDSGGGDGNANPMSFFKK